MSILFKVINDCLTERDGQSYDPVRIGGIIAFIVYNVVTVVHSFDHHHAFDPIAYSTGISILLGVISAGITYKYKQE